MMKKCLLYIMTACTLLCACQQEEVLPISDKGALMISELGRASQTSTEISSRAVNEDLIVELYKADTFVREITVDELQQTISLDPASDYCLKVYSANYKDGQNWTNDEKGEPVYYKEVPFTVVEGEITGLKVQVPMINFAVRLNVANVVNMDWIESYSFTVKCGERTVTLMDGETAYFPYEGASSFEYTLTLTNTDAESNELRDVWGDHEEETIQTNTVYDVVYNWAESRIYIAL